MGFFRAGHDACGQLLMWEFIDGKMTQWPFTAPTNSLDPGDTASLSKLQSMDNGIVSAAQVLDALFDRHEPATARRA